MLQPVWQQAQKVMHVDQKVESKEALLALFSLLREEIKQCYRRGPCLTEPQYTATAGAIVSSILFNR